MSLEQALKEIANLPTWLQPWAVLLLLLGMGFAIFKGLRDRSADPPSEPPSKAALAGFDLFTHNFPTLHSRLDRMDERLYGAETSLGRLQGVPEALQRLTHVLEQTKDVTHSAKNRSERAVELLEELGRDVGTLARRVDEIDRDGAGGVGRRLDEMAGKIDAGAKAAGETTQAIGGLSERITAALRRRGG